MTRLDDIPAADAAPPLAGASEVVARIRSYRASRRSVLRALVIAAAASALVPLDWYLTRREAVAQSGDQSEHSTCVPAEYDPAPNNWWEDGGGSCYGGWRRGSFPCSGGYHREGSFSGRGESYTSTRLATNCRGRNAWRWNGTRCSDAMTTTVFEDGTEYNAVTIAACSIGGFLGTASSDVGSGDGGTGTGEAPTAGETPAGDGSMPSPMRTVAALVGG